MKFFRPEKKNRGLTEREIGASTPVNMEEEVVAAVVSESSPMAATATNKPISGQKPKLPFKVQEIRPQFVRIWSFSRQALFEFFLFFFCFFPLEDPFLHTSMNYLPVL